MATQPPLPEGTDSIIAGASVIDDDDVDFMPAPELVERIDAAPSFQPSGGTSAGGLRGAAQALKQDAADQTAGLREQATDRARDWVEQGRDRAVSSLDDVARMIGDTAAQVDDKVGEQYGDYARRAAEAVTGFADRFRERDVDTLFADGRDLIRRSPGMAISAAAVAGFALVRLVRSAIEAEADRAATKTEVGPGEAGDFRTGV